jgi:hypothetical protein
MKKTHNIENQIVKAPRNYLIHSKLFPLEPSCETKEIPVKNLNGEEEIYIVNGNLNNYKEDKYRLVYLCVEHLQLLLAILYLRETQKISQREYNQGIVYFSLEELCSLIGKEANSEGNQYTKGLLKDLRDCEFAIKSKDRKKPRIYHIIRDFDLYSEIGSIGVTKKLKASIYSEDKQEEFGFAHEIDNSRKSVLWINEEINPLLEDTIGINLNVLRAMKSKIGKILYVYVTTRACNARVNDKWEINLYRLFDSVKLDIEKTYRVKSVRKKAITQGKPSILDRLDGAYTQHNKILRVEMELNKKENDYKLMCWVEECEEQKNASKTLEKWIEWGGNSETYHKCRKRDTEIHPNEIRLFGELGINLLEKEESYVRHWKTIKSLFIMGVGTKESFHAFEEVLSTLNAQKNEKRIRIKNSGGLIMSAMDERLKSELKAKLKK